MKKINFVTGIDDIGTMNGKSEGWTFISFPEEFLQEFNASAKEILKQSGLKSFHAKEFKRKKSEHYKSFLELIKNTLAKGESSFICCTLLEEKWKKEYKIFCENIVGSSSHKSDIKDEKMIEAYQKISAPFFTYQRISAEIINGEYTSIDIDKDAITNRLVDSVITINENEISSLVPILASLAAYGRECFPSAPAIKRNSINILSDEESFLIQAADMFGNFSTAFTFKALGKTSKSNDLKSNIFKSIFGELINTMSLEDSVSLEGEDLILKHSGSFTLCVH